MRLKQFTQVSQKELFKLREEDELLITPKTQKLIEVLELIMIEKYVFNNLGEVGRNKLDRVALARSLVAKIVLGITTTEGLIERLRTDVSLRRICGFSRYQIIATSSTFSRANQEFAEMGLANKVHEALIKRELGDQLMCHMKYDGTAIEAREKAAKKEKLVPKPKRKRGRPRKGEVVEPKAPTILQKQQNQTLEQMLEEMPKQCDCGTKKDAKGFKHSWKGYKLHIATGDNDIPIAAVLSSASMHDSGAILPLMELAKQRTTWLYDLADSAYCSDIIRDTSRQNDRVPLIEHNPRNSEKIEFLPHEARRYNERSGAERPNSNLKDNRGGRYITTRGHQKVFSHLMFGILVLAAEQLLRLVT